MPRIQNVPRPDAPSVYLAAVPTSAILLLGSAATAGIAILTWSGPFMIVSGICWFVAAVVSLVWCAAAARYPHTERIQSGHINDTVALYKRLADAGLKVAADEAWVWLADASRTDDALWARGMNVLTDAAREAEARRRDEHPVNQYLHQIKEDARVLRETESRTGPVD